MAKALSTTLVMPCFRAMPHTASRSTTSIVGLAGVSKKKTLVFGRTASANCCGSRASITVVSTPKRGSRLSVSQRQEPKAARPWTIWSPALTWHRIAAVIAAMPDDMVRQASAPSSRAIRSSSISTVGFCRRE